MKYLFTSAWWWVNMLLVGGLISFTFLHFGYSPLWGLLYIVTTFIIGVYYQTRTK